MTTPLTSIATGFAFLFSGTIARGEFEMWKNKDGKTAELELTGVNEGTLAFRTKAGKEVKLKLEDLAAEDQARAKAWKPVSPLKASFGYVTRLRGAEDSRIQLVFDLKPGPAMLSTAIKISNVKATVGGKPLEVREWLCRIDDGTSHDPFEDKPAKKGGEWTLLINAEGSFAGVALEDCEFSADLEVPCGKAPKEISATFPLPKGADLESDVEKTVDSFKVTVSAQSGPVYKKGKKGGARVGVTGYQLLARSTQMKENGESALGYDPVFHRAFVVKGKEFLDTIEPDQATDPIKVVVKYWSESSNVPLRLTKAAADKGRKPPGDPFDGPPGDGKDEGKGGKGGSDPFEE